MLTYDMQAVADGRGYKSIGDWATRNPNWEAGLYRHGYLLFRDFNIADVTAFEKALGIVMRPSDEFAEETSPRSRLSEQAYTSTDYPPEYFIQFHHEFSYRRSYPHRLAFCCLCPAEAGGATPLADSRQVLRRIPPEVVERFENLGVAYLRNFGELGVSWRNSFGMDTKEEVSRYCYENDIECTWSGDYLHTRQKAPAVLCHPVTGERCWFNSVLNLNVVGIEPESIRIALQSFSENSIPTNTCYGTGEPIEPEIIELIRQAYSAETIRFPWHKGDLLLIDNMLTAHARDPFAGPRQIVTAMGFAR